MSDLFLKASRQKFRFNTTSGHLTTEDLWDLSLESLDVIAVALDKHNSAVQERKSFIQATSTKQTRETALFADMLEVVKAVIEIKLAEKAAEKVQRDKTAQRKFLLELKSKKEMEKLEGLTTEAIDEQLKALDQEA